MFPVSTIIVATMNPVLTSDPAFLHHYAYALNVWAGRAEALGHDGQALRMRRRAYYLRTLARDSFWNVKGVE